MQHGFVRIAVYAVLVVAAVPMFAVAQGITATIDRTEATTADQLVLTVTVEGSQNATPQLPEIPDFNVYPRGSSSQISFVNGRTTASVAHNFILVPKRTGTFTIGAATAVIDGTTYRSKPFQVKILDASAAPQDSRDLFISAKVSTTQPWVGQQVIYTWRFYRRVKTADARLEPQEFPGFLVENLGEVREYNSVVGGQQYLVSEFRKALFPQEEGTLEIPGSVLTCQVLVRDQRRRRSVFDDFFGGTTTQTKVLRSQPINLKVKPLPPAPQGFSGLIGTFELSSKISKRSLQVGESTTLTLTVSGSGNAQSIAEPQLPNLAQQFKVYDDKPTATLDRSGSSISGKKTFSKALVPLAPGELVIPPVSLVFFDPASGRYQTKRSPRITLNVSPSQGTEELRLTESLAPSTGKVAVRILADDILPISRSLEALSPIRFTSLADVVLLLGLLTPALVYLGLLLSFRRQQRFAQDKNLRRRRNAATVAKKRLAVLAAATQGDDRAAAQEGSNILRSFIGDKLGIEGSALTPGEAQHCLASGGVEDQLVERTFALLTRLDAAQFGAATLTEQEIRSQLAPLLRELERCLK